jgi:hypothetical protein
MGNTGSTETRTWHLLFWVEIFKVTISEPEGRRCLSAKLIPEERNTIRTGRSLRVRQLSHHLYIASGATIPLIRLHGCREYSARATA